MKPEPSSAVRTDELTPLVPNDRRRRWEWKVSYVAGLSLVAILVIAVVRDGRSLTLRRFQNPAEFEKSSPKLGNSQLDNGQSCTRDGDCNSNYCRSGECFTKTISHIPMLATHNAGTGYFAGANSLREGALVNQMTDLVTQLNCGTRAFDFRIGTYKYSEADVLHAIPTVTGVAAGAVTGGVKQTIQMVKKGPGETTPVLFLHGEGGFAFITEDHATVESAMTDVVAWAMEHPSELLVFMLKQCQVCEKCSPGTTGAADALTDECSCKEIPDCAGKDELMAPINKLGIPIMKDCNYTRWPRSKLMEAAKMDNGAHILVVPGVDFTDIYDKPERGSNRTCILENWDARQTCHDGGLYPTKDEQTTCGTRYACHAADPTKPTTLQKNATRIAIYGARCAEKVDGPEMKTWHGSTKYYGGSDHEVFDRYLDRSLYLYGGLEKPYWLQAYWQQLADKYSIVAYATGLKSDMIEATTESKINYRVLDYLKREGNVDRVNIVSVNEVCHAGPEIAEFLGATVSADDKAKCKASCEAKKIGNRPTDEACSKDWHCQSQMCGFTEAGAHETKCCPEGKKLTMYAARDYCTTFPDGKKCWSDDQCDSGYCKGNNGGLEKGVCFKKLGIGHACTMDDDCNSYADGCGYPEAGASSQVCCSYKSIYSGNDYCTPIPDGKKCWSDDQCHSGYCKGNNGGLEKGVCFKKLGIGHACTMDDDCNSDANGCGYPEAGASSQVCCSQKSIYSGNDYCTPIPDGKKCWSDAQCYSGHCKGNNGGLEKGTCFKKLDNGQSCTMNADCKNGACGRPAAGTDSLVCCAHGITNYYGYDYCKKMSDGTKCHSNSMCNSNYCRSSKCFTKKGDWATCPAENSYCQKGNCNRTSRDGNYKCCPHGTFYCYPTTSGDCKSGFYYCKGSMGH